MLGQFLDSYFTTGIAQPTRDQLIIDDEEVCRSVEKARLDAARQFPGGDPPPIDRATAVLASRCLWLISQALVDRTITSDELRSLLASLQSITVATAGDQVPSSPHAPAFTETASTHFTAWLVLRALPYLWRGSRTIAEGDVLDDYLLAIAHRWPLTSPGLSLSPPVDTTSLRQFPSLWRLFVDLVIEAQDASAVADPAVAAAVMSSLGLHGSTLAPVLWTTLASKSTPVPESPSLL